ncbi:MAG: response regulator transcription factor [Anaerolineales bacterium]|nr:response regulator transcription factor [Anaerolineales bacterium]
MKNVITVLIVDDHEIVREGVRAYLEAQEDFNVIGEACCGEDVEELIQENIPDVVLMDLVMSGVDGVEATRRVKAISPRTQIVVLTSYHQDEYIFPALRAGAISYMIKDVKMEELADAIRRTARGEATLHPRVASRVIQELQSRNPGDVNPFTELTKREMEILKLIAQGMNNHSIAEELIISENTVRGYVSNILSKLQLADRTQAAVFAWQNGIIRRGKES